MRTLPALSSPAFPDARWGGGAGPDGPRGAVQAVAWPAVGRGRRAWGCNAQPQQGVFVAVDARLMALAPPAAGNEAAWALRLRAALARYRQAAAEFAAQPQAAVKWHELSQALQVLERMSLEGRAPPTLAAALEATSLWTSFRQAHGLCRLWLRGCRPLPPLPPPPAVARLGERLSRLRRKRRPPAADRWLVRLQENLNIYLISEGDFRRRAIPPQLLHAAICLLLGSLDPPAAGSTYEDEGARRRGVAWDQERNKPHLRAQLASCGDLLRLRRDELSEHMARAAAARAAEGRAGP